MVQSLVIANYGTIVNKGGLHGRAHRLEVSKKQKPLVVHIWQ